MIVRAGVNMILPYIVRCLMLAYCHQSLPLQVSNGVTVVNPSQQGRVGNRPSVTRQTAEQMAEIFDLVSSRLMISGTKDISSVCSAVFKSSSSTIDVHFE